MDRSPNRWWMDTKGIWNHAGIMPIPTWYCLLEELGDRAFRALMRMDV